MIDGVIRLGSSLAFVGRRSELARLEAVFTRVEDGHPTMVLVAGEAGVGKTRFTNEFAGMARSSGARVMIGGCLDVGGGGLPYAPFAEAFRTVDREPGHPMAPAGSGAAGTSDLQALVADLSGGTSGLADDPSDSQGARARLFDSVLAILTRVAAEGPSVLILEDLHWADGSTRDLIRFLIRNLRAERLLIIGTYRTDELYRDHPFMPLLTELERAPSVERLELRRFGSDEIAEQVAGILGTDPPSELVDSLVTRSDGLPFYVEELLAVDPQAALAMPTTLRDILGHRLATLGRPALGLVRAAAAIRGRVEVALLADVMGVRDATLLPSLREAVDRHILVAVDGVAAPTYEFRHALMQAAAYDDLLPDERVRLHARIADAIDARIAAVGGGLADVSDAAAHALAALDQPRALERSLQAADACTASGAVREAFEHVNRALAVWDRVPDASARTGMARWQVLRTAASLASTLGRHEDAVSLAERALREPECGARDDRVDLLGDLFLYGWEIASDEVCGTAATEAYAAVADGPPDRTMALGIKIYGTERWRQDQMVESATLLEQALALAQGTGDQQTWTEIASSLLHTYADLAYIGRATDLMGRISATGSPPDHSLRSLVAVIDTIAASWAAGRYDDAERISIALLEWATRHGLHIGVRSAARCFLADIYVEIGRFADVRRLAEPLLASDGIARVYLEWMRQSLIIAVTWEGDLAAARSHLAVLEVGRGPVQFHWMAVAEVGRAEGRFAAVADAVRASRATATQDVTASCYLLALGVAAAADNAIEARRRRQRAVEQARATDAAEWLQLLERTVDETKVGGGPGPVIAAMEVTARAEYERLLGRSDPAVWDTVVEHWSAIGQRYRTAYARHRLGEAMLARHRDRDGASHELQRAWSDAQDIGAAGLVERIEATARDARLAITDEAHPPQGNDRGAPSMGSPVALTERERAVLRLVAEGHTNREVGDRLSISDKTVSVHVSNAMGKLQALSRYEAAAAAQRLGLL